MVISVLILLLENPLKKMPQRRITVTGREPKQPDVPSKGEADEGT